MSYPLYLLPDTYGLYKLEYPLEGWMSESDLLFALQEGQTLSVITKMGSALKAKEQEEGWLVFQLKGPLPFSEPGLLFKILSPLADAKISILAYSTFDNDYILFKKEHLEEALSALKAKGITVLTKIPHAK
ncbi:MAG: ACT domain-containing protein [Chlamydiia bacterium]|nr:ACT domain-containing protein [Chlamydiia bacterium]